MKATRYPSYKPGHSKNIRLLPEHWAELPLKRLFRLEKREPLESDEIVTAFRDGTVTLRKNRREEGFTNALKEIGYQRIHRDDLVIHAMDAFAGAIGVSDSDGKSSPVYSACTATKDANPHFYAYYLRDLALHGFIESLAKGIRERSTDFRWSDASMVAVPVPPRSEQIAISTFLDRETGKIDALIAEQQRLIELLQEKRQAVISHAVTKGLNPNAPMKDSGVEWLGEVPEHWEIKKLRYVCRIQTGSRDTEEAVEDGEYPFFVRSQTVERINSYSYDCEAVLTAGDGAGVGKVFHYHTGPFDFHQRVYMLNEFNGVHGKLIFHFLKANFFKVALQGGAKSTVDSLRRPMFTGFPLCIPPKDEQGALHEHVETEEKKIEKLIATSEQAVSLLQQRRSALISAAVTGQIDVRGMAQEVAA